MVNQLEATMRFRAIFGIWGIVLAATLLMSGCEKTESTQQLNDHEIIATGDQDVSSEEKRITDIRIEETAESVVVTIVANHAADYTMAEMPMTKVIYFPDSAVALSTTDYSGENDIISTIQAVELVKGGPSKIVIPTKRPDVTCEIHRGDNGNILQVVFPKNAADESASRKG